MPLKTSHTMLFYLAVLAMAFVPRAVGQNAAVPLRQTATKAALGQTRLEWDIRTLTFVQSGTYGRMARLRNGDILCAYEAAGKAWISRSRDNGKSWQTPLLVKAIEGANAANPELLVLKNRRILLFYNQRPRRPELPFAIGYAYSDDNGATWRNGKTLFEGGKEARSGVWEPAALQLPAGEIQLFFANEFPFPDNDDQEITRLTSLDNGATWSAPATASYRAGHRDGMPVPLLLQNGTLVFSIEDNGLAPGNSLQPAIIAPPRRNDGSTPVVREESANRWGAIEPPLPGNVYAGAPYLRQMANGLTVLSCQSNQGGRAQPQMLVYVGDDRARNFRNASAPFALPNDVGALWSSLFVKDAATITALSETTVNGVRGLWAIDGRIVGN